MWRQSGKTIGGDSPASLQSSVHGKVHQQQTTGHRAAGVFPTSVCRAAFATY